MLFYEFLFLLSLLHGFYQSLWYSKCRSYQQDVAEQWLRLTPRGHSFLWYFILTIFHTIVKVVTWNETYSNATLLLSLPSITAIVCEYPKFLKLHKTLTQIMHNTINGYLGLVVVHLLNNLGTHLFGEKHLIVKFQDIEHVYQNMQLRGTLKFLVMGFVYNFLYQYDGIFFFTKPTPALRTQYLDEIGQAFGKRNFSYLLYPQNVAKLVVLYNEIQVGFLHSKILQIRSILWHEYIKLSMYWCFVAIYLDFYYASFHHTNIHAALCKFLLAILIWYCEFHQRDYKVFLQYMFYCGILFFCFTSQHNSLFCTIIPLHPLRFVFAPWNVLTRMKTILHKCRDSLPRRKYIAMSTFCISVVTVSLSYVFSNLSVVHICTLYTFLVIITTLVYLHQQSYLSLFYWHCLTLLQFYESCATSQGLLPVTLEFTGDLTPLTIAKDQNLDVFEELDEDITLVKKLI